MRVVISVIDMMNALMALGSRSPGALSNKQRRHLAADPRPRGPGPGCVQDAGNHRREAVPYRARRVGSRAINARARSASLASSRATCANAGVRGSASSSANFIGCETFVRFELDQEVACKQPKASTVSCPRRPPCSKNSPSPLNVDFREQLERPRRCELGALHFRSRSAARVRSSSALDAGHNLEHNAVGDSDGPAE